MNIRCRWCKNYSKSSGRLYLEDKTASNIDQIIEEGYIYEALEESGVSGYNMDDLCDTIYWVLDKRLKVKVDLDEESFYCSKYE